MLVLCSFLKIVMLSNKMINTVLLELIKLYKQNSLEDILIFTIIYQNYVHWLEGIGPFWFSIGMLLLPSGSQQTLN